MDDCAVGWWFNWCLLLVFGHSCSVVGLRFEICVLFIMPGGFLGGCVRRLVWVVVGYGGCGY